MSNEQATTGSATIRLERVYDATPQEVWDLYVSSIDFVPDVEPYEHLTTVDIEPSGDGVRVVMTIDPMHDDVWTQRVVAGRGNELENLAQVIDDRRR